MQSIIRMFSNTQICYLVGRNNKFSEQLLIPPSRSRSSLHLRGPEMYQEEALQCSRRPRHPVPLWTALTDVELIDISALCNVKQVNLRSSNRVKPMDSSSTLRYVKHLCVVHKAIQVGILLEFVWMTGMKLFYVSKYAFNFGATSHENQLPTAASQPFGLSLELITGSCTAFLAVSSTAGLSTCLLI